MQGSTREQVRPRRVRRRARDATRRRERPVNARLRESAYDRLRVRSTRGERWLGVRVALRLVTANVRYWTSVAPLVRVELRRWSRRASAIPDEALRDVALGKLRREHFNAEVAATLATLAPASQRARVVEAIVAFEVLYDYLDALSEQRGELPLQSGRRLYEPFVAVFEQPPSHASLQADGATEEIDDDGYLRELAATARAALAQLPGERAVIAAGRRAAQRCAEAQIRVHATPRFGEDQLERWARQSGSGSELPGWRDYIAGAVASVLSAHALIATAAESATEEQADAVDATYLSISALSTMLDSVVDHERDVVAGDPWLLRLYGDPRVLSEHLGEVSAVALAQARRLPHADHHLMTLLGVVAYYTSAREASRPPARTVVERLHRELRPLILPTLLVMRCWRLAKWIWRTNYGDGDGGDPGDKR